MAKGKFTEDSGREKLRTLMDNSPSHDRKQKNTGLKIFLQGMITVCIIGGQLIRQGKNYLWVRSTFLLRFKIFFGVKVTAL